MVEMYAHFPVVMWIIDGLIWALGVFFWILTYIVAPLKSRKKGILFQDCREWLSSEGIFYIICLL